MTSGIYKHKKHSIETKNKIKKGLKKFYSKNDGWKKGKKSLKDVGKNNPNWKGGKFIKNGYVYVYCPNHPNSNKNYIKEHRIIMEEKLCRYLKLEEVIHHINGIKTDNRIENLQLITNSEHLKIHYKKRKIDNKGRFI